MNGTDDDVGTEVRIAVDDNGGAVQGTLVLPERAGGRPPVGLVLFAHGSGSSRFSPRNRRVAEALHEKQLGTLLFDLLTPEEERVDLITRHLRFDIGLLASRLALAADWCAQEAATRDLPLGFFGASTGAAAALVAASRRPDVFGVVSRGGRPDLAGAALARVEAPVLLLVGGLDVDVLELNREALRAMARARSRFLEIIPGASHLFEEAGALERVARVAATWLRERAEEAAGERPAPATGRPRAGTHERPGERL